MTIFPSFVTCLTYFWIVVVLLPTTITSAWMTTSPTTFSRLEMPTTTTTTSFPRRRITTTTTTSLYDSMDDDSSSAASQLPLTEADLSRLAAMRSRHEKIPIMILDTMLPGQRLEFGSTDPKFQKLVEHVLENGQEVGMIGINPHTGRPLNMGVTLPIREENLKSDAQGNLVISVQGSRRFEVQGEPWLDESSSFYMADVEIVDGRFEPIPKDLSSKVSDGMVQIPDMVEEWMTTLVAKGHVESQHVLETTVLQELGPMPETPTERAMWIAALLNPVPSLKVCLEIRPAMLACKNEYDRIHLAMAALQSSMDHMNGKNKLF